jgi:hypothetical protein
LVWSIQHSRGNAVGVHACTTITIHEGKLIEKMLKANNPIIAQPQPSPALSSTRRPLQINTTLNASGCLRYEHALKALLIRDVAKGLHRNVLGDYDDYIPNLLTSARKEIDLVLLKYDESNIIWYEIIELKKEMFDMDGLHELTNYEKWFIQTRVLSPIQVHPIAIAFDFDAKVKEYVKKRSEYKDRPLRLIKYRYYPLKDELVLQEFYVSM